MRQLDPKLELAQFGSKLSKSVGKHEKYMGLISRFRTVDNPLEQVSVDEKIRNFELKSEEVNGDVLIPMFHPSVPRLVFAHAFRTRGYNPVIFRCNSDLNVCFWKNLTKYDDFTCDSCKHKSDSVLNEFGLYGNEVYMSDLQLDYEYPYFDKYEYSNINHKNIDITGYANASVRKYFKKYNINFDNKEEEQVFKYFLEDGVKLVEAAHSLFSEFDIKAVVGGDPSYIYDGVIFSVAEKLSVPAAAPGPGWREGKRILGFQNNRDPNSGFTDIDAAMQYVNKELTDKEKNEIESVMSSRRQGEDLTIDHTVYANDSNNIEPSDSYQIGLFTNLLWDAALESRDMLFPSPFEWVKNTIDVVSESDKSKLIIKIHPAEKIHGTNESMLDWIQEQYNSIPDSVTILEPDTDVSTYDLYNELDVGVIYNSTTGLEMTYEGIPVIVVGDTHYRDLGFTIEPKNIPEYNNLLKNTGKIGMSEEEKIKARRYAHLLFVERHFDYPYDFKEDEDVINIRHDDIKLGNEPFDTVIEKILEGNPIFTN